MPHATQWTNVPPGASGSSTSRASCRVPDGTPATCSGGETFSPSQVYRRGMVPPSVNAVLDTVMDIDASGRATWGALRSQPAVRATRITATTALRMASTLPPVAVQDGVVGTAAEYWRDQRASWAIPPSMLRAGDESPGVLPVEYFVERARRYAADPVGASYARAVEALMEPGSVLDVGAGAGAASLPLLGTGRVTELTAV